MVLNSFCCFLSNISPRAEFQRAGLEEGRSTSRAGAGQEEKEGRRRSRTGMRGGEWQGLGRSRSEAGAE